MAEHTGLRVRLERGESVLMPGVWDALSARLAADAGFSTVFLSGFCLSGTGLAAPDVGLLTQTEVAEAARRVCAAVPELSVVVDADTGYGNVANVARTVELWEQAGAAGIFLEDQVWPKRCGHMEGKEVVPRDEWLGKLRAALGARSASNALHVTARTDARGAIDLAEALERGRMARDLGVDAVFVEAPQSLEELDAIAQALPGTTLVANMVETGKTPLLTPAELAERGFTLIVSPVSVLFAAVKAMRSTLDRLATAGTLRDDLDQLVDFSTFTGIVGLPAHEEMLRSAATPG